MEREPQQISMLEQFDKAPQDTPPVAAKAEHETEEVYCEACNDAPGGCPQCGFRSNGLNETDLKKLQKFMGKPKKKK